MKKINQQGFSLPFVVFTALSFLTVLTIFSFRFQIDKKLGAVLEAQTSFPTSSSLGLQESSVIVSVKNDDPSLIKFNFTDLFSGNGWIDSEKTNLTQDLAVTAFSFSPIISWVKISDGIFENIDPNQPICIENECADVRGNLVYFKGNPLKLPQELEGKSEIVSVGKVENVFLISGTVKNGGIWNGYSFFFNGKEFLPTCGAGTPIFSSSYKGEIGGGGSRENFVLLYGGYDGKGIQVLNGVCNDISGYLGMRLMSGGFSPRVIPSVSDWYVWSATSDIPRLFKLVGNPETKKISGVVDFVPLTFPSGVRSAFFKEGNKSGNEKNLIAKVVLPSGKAETWQFTDKGFSGKELSVIVSKNLNTNKNFKIRSAKITNTFLSPGDSSVEFFLSNDGDEWSRATVGEEVSFLNNKGNQLLWKAIFHSLSETNFPPFFGQINIEYKAKP